MIKRFAIVAVMPLILFADVAPRAIGPDPLSASEIQSRADQAKINYQQGLLLTDTDRATCNWYEAARFFRKAADAGYAPAQFELAHLYADGLGVTRSLKQAVYWYGKAADQGDAEAENNLGSLYAQGRGVHRSVSRAAHWYGLAAAQGDPGAISNLGVMYLRGKGVKRDPARAFELFLRAAQMGYAAAQNYVAMMYANGQGVGRDYIWAYAWLDLAAKEISGARQLRDEVGKRMTADDIERAETLAGRKAAQIAKSQEGR